MYIEEDKTSKGRSFALKALLIFAGVLFGFFITRIFFQTYTVNGDSMLPGLKNGERVVVLKNTTPQPFDVVLFESPVDKERIMLKRVIARAGDVVEIIDKIILINNIEMQPKWHIYSEDVRIFPVQFSYRDNMPPLRIENGEFFLIGDNLDLGYDSREFGAAHENNIIGKVLFKY